VTDDPVRIDALQRVATSGRDVLREVWSRRDDRAGLAPELQQLLELLERHKEWRAYWEGAEPEPGSNPFLHVTYHEVLRKQVESGEPPETDAALRRLQAGGLDAHAAEHRVMEVLIVEMYRMLQDRAPFAIARYRERLSELAP
jgi:hypothetical protein